VRGVKKASYAGRLFVFIKPQASNPMAFSDNLKQLPGVSHLAALRLIDANARLAGTIENKPGQAGSLAIYAALAQRHGSINTNAAAEGLALYAEHTADAIAHPGKHPNIDRLIAIRDGGEALTVEIVPA